MSKSDIVILDGHGSAYLKGKKVAVVVTNSRGLYNTPTVKPTPITVEGKEYRGVVNWGTNNNLPAELTDKMYKNPVMSSGLQFNVLVAYGSGIQPGKYEMRGDKMVFVPVYDDTEINTFFEENDVSGYLLEQMTDLSIFYNVFPEIILNMEREPKIVQLNSKEATFSRWEEMNPDTGEIEHHFYSAQWDKGTNNPETVIDVTPVLKKRGTLRDLRIRMGMEKDDKGNFREVKDYRFIVPVSFPTPGRPYYSKPYYISIIESGWYDLACSIPEFKNAILKNQMAIKYHVELSEDYFEKIFQQEGITDEKAKKNRIKKEYQDLNDFLAGAENAGKSAISFVKYTPDGKVLRRMTITRLDSVKEGGEYLEDSEEASNVMSFGMGVHPSIIGSAPGKSKTVNGTEARELFIIKQALMKPIRDRILRPLYLIKNFNKWDPAIQFEIPNIVLTTIDQNTGSQKVIS